MKQPAVYMMAGRRNGTLHIGVTSNLVQRIWEHKNDLAEDFTRRYKIHLLVWFEIHDRMASAPPMQAGTPHRHARAGGHPGNGTGGRGHLDSRVKPGNDEEKT